MENSLKEQGTTQSPDVSPPSPPRERSAGGVGGSPGGGVSCDSLLGPMCTSPSLLG